MKNAGPSHLEDDTTAWDIGAEPVRRAGSQGVVHGCSRAKAQRIGEGLLQTSCPRPGLLPAGETLRMWYLCRGQSRAVSHRSLWPL